MVWSRRRHGACAALVWDGSAGLYRCGLLVQVQNWRPLASLVRRWMGGGQGCDCHWEPVDAVASLGTVKDLEQERQHGSQ